MERRRWWLMCDGTTSDGCSLRQNVWRGGRDCQTRLVIAQTGRLASGALALSQGQRGARSAGPSALDGCDLDLQALLPLAKSPLTKGCFGYPDEVDGAARQRSPFCVRPG